MSFIEQMNTINLFKARQKNRKECNLWYTTRNVQRHYRTKIS